jgi:hypothetical protein
MTMIRMATGAVTDRTTGAVFVRCFLYLGWRRRSLREFLPPTQQPRLSTGSYQQAPLGSSGSGSYTGCNGHGGFSGAQPGGPASYMLSSHRPGSVDAADAPTGSLEGLRPGLPQPPQRADAAAPLDALSHSMGTEETGVSAGNDEPRAYGCVTGHRAVHGTEANPALPFGALTGSAADTASVLSSAAGEAANAPADELCGSLTCAAAASAAVRAAEMSISHAHSAYDGPSLEEQQRELANQAATHNVKMTNISVSCPPSAKHQWHAPNLTVGCFLAGTCSFHMLSFLSLRDCLLRSHSACLHTTSALSSARLVRSS